VDGERAERHLRLVAEAELRRVRAQPGQDAGGGAVPLTVQAIRRLSRISGTLMAVGAIDEERVEALAHEFRTALGVRGLDPPGLGLHIGRARLLRLRGLGHQPTFVARGTMAGVVTAVAASTAPAAPPAVTGPAGRAGPDTTATAGPPAMRVIPVGRMLPFREEEAHGEVYLLSLVLTADAAMLPAVVHIRKSPSGPVVAAVRTYILPFQAMTAVDDAGRSYRLDFTGGGHADVWEGHFTVDPVPPPGARWLQVTSGSGEPAARIDLTAPAGAADATVERAPSTAGERLLDAVAVNVMVGAALNRPPDTQPAGALSDIVATLEIAGALSALSPAPGRLAALCQRLGLDTPGIPVPPAAELPGPWLDLIAYYGRRHQPRVRDGIAALSVLLPELDGIWFALAGLHAHDDQTTLYVVARGLPPLTDRFTAGAPVSFGSTWWLRDDTGRWHVATTREWSDDGRGTRLALRVYPPLGRAVTSAELVVTGTTARIRTHLPVSWWAAA
jgi:hypothetical protein